MKYFSLFSGIGGFELGIGKRGKCVGFSEVDKYAIQIYQKHFPEHKNYGDIKNIKTEDLPEFDLLVGGFPCQSFSIAGKRRGFDDTRGTMFFEIARILKAKQPRLLLLENVKGLLSHEEGRTFATIISTLDELGYDLQWQVLNSKNFGVPQNRERVFIVGHLRGTSRPKVFPLSKDDKNVNGQNKQIEGGRRQPKIGIDIANSVTPDAYLTKGERKRVDGKAVLTSMHERRIRRFTPTECERLQGFPDGWTEGVSDTQRYKCLGNAVTINVIRGIVNKIMKFSKN